MMRKTRHTITELYAEQDKTMPFLLPIDYSTLNYPAFFLTHYIATNNYGLIDSYLVRMYGELNVSFYNVPVSVLTDLNSFKQSFTEFCFINLSYYNDYYATTRYDYNPIENYNQTEKEIIKHTNQSTNVANYGDNVTSVVNGKRQSDSTQKTSPFDDSANLYQTGQTGTITQSATDTSTNKAHNDSFENDEIKNMEREFSRKGNVGVMTTQAMINEERAIIINMMTKLIDEFIEWVNVGY